MSLKRKLTQNDLRKAMNDHKKKMGTIKKIESPLAKYSDSGQLMCILCKSVVRSETVWVLHLNSKMHKDNIALAKKTKLEPENVPKVLPATLKRPSSPAHEHTESKKIKSILKNGTQPSSRSQGNLPADFFDKAPSVSTDSTSLQISNIKVKLDNSVSNDNTESQKVEVDQDKDKAKDPSQAALPEGFFDDPIMDAKVRNVEYKDPIEEEWEKFRKEIKEETAQSAQIIADDQEEATTERQLDEIEEQIRHWSRVMDLVRRKEQVQTTDRKQENVDEDVSSGDEAEFDEFLDWRAKNSYK
ncbi:zinc finger protein 830 [Cephus cinctus]|uniref:Zinc finger protein 830 n=1 Tax=Cephus cinctus TaxID=211228 RepID=A0AAJ7BMU2_CEPCN|nr:zinc finger protein 830 [Cephus cinctus]